jgi:adenylate cyclase
MPGNVTAVQAFLAELKRRRVFRVAAVYGATAFVVLQGADLVFPHLGLPPWTLTLAVALALIGLPIALALAWAFDATADGVRREAAATPAELATIIALPRSRRWPAGVAALAGIVLLAGGAWWTVIGAGTRPGTYDSIAVLPFANLSGDAADDYFGDGLAEELLNALSSIDGLKVAARTSAFAFKGTSTDVRVIGDTLRVAAVLEGSVRRTSDRLRISAQLIDARSGYRLWSETYDRPLADLFTIQDAIAAEIVSALAVRLTGAAREAGLHRGGTTDVEAYDLYLLGRQKWATRQITLLHEAVEHFEQAIARDSSFALAWSGLADAIDALAWRRDPSALLRVGEAQYAAQRAILLDPGLAEGWASLGVLAVEFDYDWAVGELALRHAVRLKPSYAMAHDWLSDVLLYTGRVEESLAARRHAHELDPLSSVGHANYAWALAAAGRWDEARTAYRDLVLSRNTNTATPLMGVTNALRLGIDVARTRELAQEWARRVGYSRPESAAVIGEAVHRPELRAQALAVLRGMEDEGAPARELAGISLVLGEREAALRLLERAHAAKDPQLVLTAVEPTLDPLRSDPRFIEILKSLRLPAGAR